jgi:hypothetical protein
MGLPNENGVCRSAQMITFDKYTPHPSIGILFRVDYMTSWVHNGSKQPREFAVGFHICMAGVN